MSDTRLLKTGIAGVGVLAVCCFTPVLVVALGAVGLSAWLGWLDYVLLPALGLFMAIAVLGFVRWRRGRAQTSAAGAP
jgi:mercuric ion transport protein